MLPQISDEEYYRLREKFKPSIAMIYDEEQEAGKRAIDFYG